MTRVIFTGPEEGDSRLKYYQKEYKDYLRSKRLGNTGIFLIVGMIIFLSVGNLHVVFKSTLNDTYFTLNREFLDTIFKLFILSSVFGTVTHPTELYKTRVIHNLYELFLLSTE